MRLLRITDSGLTEADGPQPQPGPGEVLIRVFAAGVTPTELAWYPTSHTKDGSSRQNAVPAHEFSGVIAGAGPGTTNFRLGEEVFGMNDWFADGAMAEYCVAPVTAIARKPSRLTHAEAASVPIGALTAWQGLYDLAGLRAGERVLVHGGAGAVGVFAVQLARLRGAHVIATASARNADFVTSLGAEIVFDSRTETIENGARDVDVVFDTVGGETLQQSWNVLKPQGRMVTIAAAGEAASEERVKKAFFIVVPDRNQLMEVASLLQAGKLRTVVDSVVPLSSASKAYAGKIDRRGCGKVVVVIKEEA